MLHATLQVGQILDVFEVRVVISQFEAGQDPVLWESMPEILNLPPEFENSDPLSTLIALLALWSERTNSK